jgi:hypothetical protein
MNKETITRIKLTASEGHILTDGENYGRIVYLAQGDDGEKQGDDPPAFDHKFF